MSSNHYLFPVALIVAFCLSPVLCLVIAIISAVLWDQNVALAASTITGLVVWLPLLFLAWIYRPVRRRESKVWIYIAGAILIGYGWIAVDTEIRDLSISLLVSLLNHFGVSIPTDKVYSESQFSFGIFCLAMVALALVFGWRNRLPTVSGVHSS